MIQNNDMDYDVTRKRYQLNINYVQNELGIDIISLSADELDTNPSTIPERVIKRTSNAIYDYMKMRCKDFNYACELIEDDIDINNAFRDCLQYQLEEFIIGGDKAIDRTDKKLDNLICDRSYSILLGYGLLDKKRPPCLNSNGRYREGCWD